MLPEVVHQRRDKIGFETPEKEWFRTMAYEPTREVLESDSFRQRGYFNVPEIRRQFALYRDDTSAVGIRPWALVILELWLRMFIDRDPTNCVGYVLGLGHPDPAGGLCRL